MSQNNFKEKISAKFNGNAGRAMLSGIKGSSIGVQLTSFAIKAGLVATAAPICLAAAAGGGALLAGSLVAYDKFKTAVRKAKVKAIEEAQIAEYALGLNYKPKMQLQLLPVRSF